MGTVHVPRYDCGWVYATRTDQQRPLSLLHKRKRFSLFFFAIALYHPKSGGRCRARGVNRLQPASPPSHTGPSFSFKSAALLPCHSSIVSSFISFFPSSPPSTPPKKKKEHLLSAFSRRSESYSVLDCYNTHKKRARARIGTQSLSRQLLFHCYCASH